MKRVLAVVAVVVLALCLRLLILPLAYGRAAAGDPFIYAAIAKNIVAGNGILNMQQWFLEDRWASYPPLYPLVLAGAGLVAPLTPATFLAINFAADVATAAAMLRIGRLLNLGRAAWAAAAIYLLWPTNILNSPAAQKEPLLALGACVLVGLLLTSADRPRWAIAALFGITSALVVLTQPALVTLPALLALALMCRFPSRRDWMQTVAIGSAAFVLMMLPWWIRNYLIFERFVPFTTSGGFNFWVGTFYTGVKWFPPPPRFNALPDAFALSHAAVKEAVQWIAAHPLEYARHCLLKATTLLVPDQWINKPLRWMQPPVMPLPFIDLVSGVAWAGAVSSAVFASRRPSPLRRIMVACLVQLLGVQLWFQFPERHRYFLVPLLLMLGASGLRDLVAIRSRSVAAHGPNFQPG